jgi:Skp family chaperone for outer membrane proteins
VKKTFAYLLALLATGGAISYVLAQNPPMGTNPPATTTSSQPARTGPRICLVNIAKVLKDFNKANQEGMAISKRRQFYVDSVKPMRERLAELSRQIQAAPSETVKAQLKEQALQINRQIEDLDHKAQEELTQMSDRVIVEVYKQIKAAISDIAMANNIDLVMCYPDASDEKDDGKAAIAQLKLQTPALTPFYHKGMDITDYVIRTLNARHPAPPVERPAAPSTPGAAPATPMNTTPARQP